MTTPEIPKLCEVVRDIAVKVDVCQRRHSCIVVGPQRGGKTTAPARLRLERSHKRTSDPFSSVLPAHNDRMKLPDAGLVFRQTAHPAQHDVTMDHRAGETVAHDSGDLLVRQFDAGPSTRLVELFDKQHGSLLEDLGRLTGEINNLRTLKASKLPDVSLELAFAQQSAAACTNCTDIAERST
jgi:hypothetical protein